MPPRKTTTTKRPRTSPTKPIVQADADSPAVESIVERKSRLASDLLDDAVKLRGQLFHPTVRKEVKVTGLGEGVTEAEVVTVELDEPTFADKKLIVGAIGIIVDKLHALDTGAGTGEQKGGTLHAIKGGRTDRRAAANTSTPTGRRRQQRS